eukprot:GILI01026374.1.p1 GENE.GILI01026374.1~~GILI01026374.1.p1  ORF type:complete len:471 (+),score=68.43 GILI01026374.1:130-1413(+)
MSKHLTTPSTPSASLSNQGDEGFVTFVLTPLYRPLKIMDRSCIGVVAVAQVVKANAEDHSEKDDASLVFVKKIDFSDLNLCLSRCVFREVRLLRRFRDFPHPNLLALRDLSSSLDGPSESAYIITNFMDSNLEGAMRFNNGFSEAHAKFLLYQLLKGLFALHSLGLVHRNINPRSLLVNRQCELKINEFAHCTYSRNVFAHDCSDCPETCSSFWYSAPEILLNLPYCELVDIWAAGCVFAEMLNGGKVYLNGDSPCHQLDIIFRVVGRPSRALMGHIKNVNRQAHEQLQKKFASSSPIIHPLATADVRVRAKLKDRTVSDEAVDLLLCMLELDREKRFSAEDCMRHPYFASYFKEEDLIYNSSYLDLKLEDLDDLSPQETVVKTRELLLDESLNFSETSEGVSQPIRVLCTSPRSTRRIRIAGQGEA